MNARTGGDANAVGKLPSRLLTGAVSRNLVGRSRIATFGRLFEGTDEISLGQTCSERSPAAGRKFTFATAVTRPE